MSRKIFLLFIVLAFICGIAIKVLLGENHNDQSHSLSSISPRKLDNPRYNSIYDQYKTTDVRSLVRIDSLQDVYQRRQSLIQIVFGNIDFPSFIKPQKVDLNIDDEDYANVTSLDSIDSLTLTMEYGLCSVMYYFHAINPNNNLIIYHQGHRGDFLLGKATIESLLRCGYDVIALAMPLKGKNNRPVVNIDGVGVISLANHEWMRFLDNPLSYFMNPIASAVNYGLAICKYDNVSLVGLSGGGWAVTVYAAMDNRIKNTYQVGATMPLYLRSAVLPEFKGQLGDFEQHYEPLIKATNYLEMYIMGASSPKRKHIQVINQYDTVAAHGVKYLTYEEEVKGIVRSIGGGSLTLFWTQITRIIAYRLLLWII